MDKIHLKIGSSHDNDMIIESEGVDAHHLELFCDIEGNVFITDLNTKNGTFVNGEELNGYTLLNFGDKVVLGRHYIFRWESFIRSEKPRFNNLLNDNEASQFNTKETSDIKVLKSDVSNKQLLIIYGAIILIIILMVLVL